MAPALLAALPSLIQAGTGLVQGITGAIQKRKGEKMVNRLEDTAPQYQKNKGIMDYYNTALSRYNVNPTDSAMYRRNMKNIDRGVATGINALQDRRSALGGISSLLRGANDAKLNTEVQAENQKNMAFGQLGSATQLQAQEDRTAFDINSMRPFERKYNMASMKAGAGNQMINSGIGNVFGGIQSYSNMKMMEQYYKK